MLSGVKVPTFPPVFRYNLFIVVGTFGGENIRDWFLITLYHDIFLSLFYKYTIWWMEV